jgi:hypothetical protein
MLDSKKLADRCSHQRRAGTFSYTPRDSECQRGPA